MYIVPDQQCKQMKFIIAMVNDTLLYSYKFGGWGWGWDAQNWRSLCYIVSSRVAWAKV